MNEIHINNLVDRNRWRELINSSSFSSPFQTPDFYDFFKSLDGYDADVFALLENNEYRALVVVTVQKEPGIKGYLSRRGIIYGGVLIDRCEKNELIMLLEKIKTFYRKKLIYIETRNFFDYSPYKELFGGCGWEYVPYLNFILDCTDFDHVWRNLNRRRRREIKIAREEGVLVEETKSTDDQFLLYKILENLYQNKIKKPLFPWVFFENFLKTKIGKCFVVKSNGKVIGGVICACLEDKTIYGWYGAGLDQEYKKESPVVMAIISVIEYASKNGYRQYDFMGAGKPTEEYGVRKFKSEFGGTLVEYGRFRLIANPFFFKLGTLGLKMASIVKKKTTR